MEAFDFSFTQNPWWEDKQKINQDPLVEEFNRSQFKYWPLKVLNLPFKKGAVHILTGPRQIGKTTAVKLLIQKLLLEKSTLPKRIFYFNCDVLSSKQALAELVLEYLKFDQSGGIKYIFLDEVTAIDDWPYAIKWLADSGNLKGTTLLLTGSSSVSLKKSGEYLPGRRGGGKDIHFLPLSFSDYLKVLEPKLALVNFSRANFKSLKDFEREVAIKKIPLASYCQNFLVSGGFPRVINDLLTHQNIMPDTLNLYKSWIKSEVAKSGKSEEIAHTVIRTVLSSLGSPLSYKGLAEYSSLGSHNTAKDYLDFFKASFILGEAPFFDINQKKLLWRKNRKFYPLDPFIFWLLRSWRENVDDVKLLAKKNLALPEFAGKFAESVVFSELLKKGLTPYYFKNSREIDFVFSDQTPHIEVKYQEKVISSDFKPLMGKRKAFLITKNQLAEYENVLFLPLPLFLSLAN